jgi:uncharacterized protein YabE (DUF348 family)
MVWRLVLTFILFTVSVSVIGVSSIVHAQDGAKRLITLYDGSTTRVFLTSARTLSDALKAEHVQLDAHDTVEPSINAELVASEYYVNVYHARPIMVVDGATRIRILSAHQTAKQIAGDAGIVLYDGDTTNMQLDSYGTSLELVVTRAVPVTLNLYGKSIQVRTQSKTVTDFLKEKNIILGKGGQISIPGDTPITQGMEIRVWREGVQTVSEDQAIPVISKIVYDENRPIGYRQVQTQGVPGIRSVTYQINIKAGIEISRVEIATIITRSPTEQVEVIGLQNDGSGLTKAKGAQFRADSKGVSHRETYYDLNMHTAMESCGQGSHYSVRPDGAKVDGDGYIIVAADYLIYPKCSLVETSLGTGKVYDTGGFVARFPYGYDLATDWSVPDGI